MSCASAALTSLVITSSSPRGGLPSVTSMQDPVAGTRGRTWACDQPPKGKERAQPCSFESESTRTRRLLVGSALLWLPGGRTLPPGLWLWLDAAVFRKEPPALPLAWGTEDRLLAAASSGPAGVKPTAG